jgi:20S proteasome subunit beta 6
VYHFDVVGSFQREQYRADGTAQELIQPLLDNQVGLKNQTDPDRTPISLDRALRLVRDGFNVATERDIYTGDAVEVHIITRDGVRVETFELRKD